MVYRIWAEKLFSFHVVPLTDFKNSKVIYSKIVFVVLLRGTFILKVK